MNPASSHNRRTYDRIAPLYLARQLEYRGGDPLFGALERRWIEALPARARVCDVGCGPALDGARFAEAGFRVIGVDLSAGMLRNARRGLPGMVVQADMRELPLRPASLDGAWCVASLLHVPEQSTVAVLEQVRAALRPGGILGLVTALGEGNRFEPVPYSPNESRWFVYRDRPRLEQQIEASAFRIIFSDQNAASRLWLATLAQAL